MHQLLISDCLSIQLGEAQVVEAVEGVRMEEGVFSDRVAPLGNGEGVERCS